MEALDRRQLLLFVLGNGARSVEAIRVVRKACAATGGRRSLKVIDVFNEPALVEKYRVVATPTLVALGGIGERRLVGTISEQEVRDHFAGDGHLEEVSHGH